MRIRLDLKYDGTGFYGWAKQAGLRTVQAELECALAKVLPSMWGKQVATIVGGRTDTGVHAKHQVVHFDIENEHNAAPDGAHQIPIAHPTTTTSAETTVNSLEPSSSLNVQENDTTHSMNTMQACRLNVNNAFCEQLLYRLSCVLPEDIVVYSAQKTHPEFSARFWAKRRTYKYRICDTLQYRDPLRRFDVFYTKRHLDVQRMNEAVHGFTGVHDFAAFVKPRKGATSTRNLQHFKFKRVHFGADKGLVVATVKADAFAYNMVRSLVGAAILVGQGQRSTRWMHECLESKRRQGATGPVAARGLTLEKIDYMKSPARAAKRVSKIKQRRQN